MNSGVYIIRNLVNGKVYVGSSANVRARFARHLQLLQHDYHPNAHLQSAWNLFGQESFEFAIAERCEVKALLSCEQWWIDDLNAADRAHGYNLAQIAGAGMRGRKHSPETIAKMSAAHKGRHPSPETLAKMRAAQKGHHVSPETLAKMRAGQHPRSAETNAKAAASMRARWASDPDFRKRLRLALQQCRKQSTATLKATWRDSEFRARMTEIRRKAAACQKEANVARKKPALDAAAAERQALLGSLAADAIAKAIRIKKRVISPETRAKMSAAKRTPEALARRATLNRERNWTPEMRAKISAKVQSLDAYRQKNEHGRYIPVEDAALVAAGESI